MDIYISKITFEDAGGGGGITTPCYITEKLQGYSDNVMGEVTQSVVNDMNYTNALTEEWDVNNKSATNQYSGYTQLVYAPAIDISNVTHMGNMFYNCNALKYVPTYNTSKVINMSCLFYRCYSLTSLDLSGWDTSEVVYMQRMFNACAYLSTIVGISDWDTSNVTDMSDMFSGCKCLTSLDLSKWNVSNVLKTGSMFYDCLGLTSLNLNNWNLSKVNYGASMFTIFGTSNLVDLMLDNAVLPNINLNNLGFDKHTKLSVDSLVGILNALPITTNSYTLTLGTTNLGKLTDEQKTIATNKGWTLN